MRLIDADRLKEALYKVVRRKGIIYAIDVEKLIDDAPTVSASEVYVYLQDETKWLDKYIGKKGGKGDGKQT